METKAKRIRKFDRQADLYDRRRARGDDAAMRGRLLRSARGRVLELGVGAGGNFPYYPDNAEITAVDISPAMLERARAANERHYGYRIDFVESDVEQLDVPPHSYDTVVSTLTLCTYDQPVEVLRRIGQWCKPGGRILLMEHGLSTNRLLSFGLKALDPLYSRIAGCHCNRDILQLVTEAGLHVERAERYMAGMMHVLWCKPEHP